VSAVMPRLLSTISLTSALQDLRHAARSLARSRGFAVVSVGTLALGIGATTAIFSVVDGVLLRPLRYPDSDRMVQVWQLGRTGRPSSASEPNVQEWHDWSRSFSALTFYESGVAPVVGGSEPVRGRAAAVSREFFDVLRTRPLLGRLFASEEQRLGGRPAILISHGFWQRYLGGERDLSKLRLIFLNVGHDIVGVMPAGFGFPDDSDFWVPAELVAAPSSRTALNWKVVGRLRPGVTLEAARDDMRDVARRQRDLYGEAIRLTGISLVPLHEEIVGRVRRPLLVLFGAVGFLLLIACVNVSSLLLARAAAKQREVAVRVALGASFWRLVRQSCAETLILTLAGSGFGILVAHWGVNALVALEPGALPRADEVRVNQFVILFAFVISLTTAFILGLLPPLRARRTDIEKSLREGGHGHTGGVGVERIWRALMIVQVALTVVLLSGAALLGRTFVQLLAVDPGFHREGVAEMEISTPSDRAAGERVFQFFDEVRARIASVPGIAQASLSGGLPLGHDGSSGRFQIEGNPGETGYAEYREAGPGYFETVGIPLLAGRLFEERDGRRAPHVAVISNSAARAIWPDRDPIGVRIHWANMDEDEHPITIVGIVGDVRAAGLDKPSIPAIYVCSRQRRAGRDKAVVFRYRGNVDVVVRSAREIVRQLDPTLPVSFRTIEEVVAASIADRRFNLILLGTFGTTATLLAAAGIYGLMAYAVAQRRREMAIRIALGAQPEQMRRLMIRSGIAIAAAGLALGIPASLVLTRLLAGLLFGVTPADPSTYAAVAALVVGATLSTSYFPARFASRVDPMTALRAE
jgi:putative ABC transport system permease protein